MTIYDDDLVTITLRTRGPRKCWAEFERREVTVREARELRRVLVAPEDAKEGDRVFIRVNGTLSQIYATEPHLERIET